MGGARAEKEKDSFWIARALEKYLVPHPQQRPNTERSHVKWIPSGLLAQSPNENEVRSRVQKFGGGGGARGT